MYKGGNLMRSIAKILLFINIFLITNIALSQRFITGWKVGPNVSTLSITEGNSVFGEQLKSKNVSQIGIDFGIFKTIPLREKWEINAEVFYQLRRCRIGERKQYFSYLNINPSAQYYVSDDIAVFSGINFGVLLNALEVYKPFSDSPLGDPSTIESNRNKYYTTIDLQWTAGMEVKVNDLFGVEFRGALSLFDVNAQYDKKPGIPFTTLKFWSLSLTTKFYLKSK